MVLMFISGALQAWVADEVGEGDLGRVYLRGEQADYLGSLGGVLAFALAPSFAFAIGTFWFASLVRKLGEPLYLTWLNQGLDPKVRATVISMGSQANALGQIVGGPVIGAVGTLAGIRAALAVAGLILSPALALYGRAHRHGGVEPGLEGVESTDRES